MVSVAYDYVTFSYRRLTYAGELEYEVSIILNRSSIALVSPASLTKLTYRSDGGYEIDPRAEIKKRIGEWAIVTTHYGP